MATHIFTSTKGVSLYLTDSGGKAGKGRNKTASLQVRHAGRIVKQFRFKTDSLDNYRGVRQKAVEFCSNHPGDETTT